MSSNFVKPGPGWPDNDVDIGKTLLASSQVLKHIKAAYRNTTHHCSCLLWFRFISSDVLPHNTFAAYWDAKAGFDHVWTFTSDVISPFRLSTSRFLASPTATTPFFHNSSISISHALHSIISQQNPSPGS
jgi:hypothetical protein